ncbi:MAG: toll/interleukin-1 receptor domain-containing protein [Anaerolineae bacterium]|nr:toll/interleukin-1 receptor domain-containing protein [Anaerolineae bacterium]
MENGSIFISHSHKDIEWARRIAGDLEHQLFRVWLDRLEIDPSEAWPNEIKKGLSGAGIVLVIWTKHAAESEWVQKELIYALELKKMILPLVFDDTPLDLPIINLQYVNFREGYFDPIRELFVFLQKDFQQQEERKGIVNRWRPSAQPDLRNIFLHKNNYSIDLDQDDFGRNKWTNCLKNYGRGYGEWLPGTHFVSIVTVPVEHNVLINVDFDEVSRFFPQPLQPNTGTRQLANDAPPFRHFPIQMFRHERHLKPEYMRFDPVSIDTGLDGTQISRFLRIAEDGEIEFADGMRLLFIEYSKNVDLVELNYVGLLGAMWQLLFLAGEIYNRVLNYQGKIQLLINIVGASGSIIGGFAERRSQGRKWRSPLEDIKRESSFGNDQILQEILACRKYRDKNIQYTYELEVGKLFHDGDDFWDLVEHFGYELQRIYNVKERNPYHYDYGTEQFPWNQYYRDVWQY